MELPRCPDLNEEDETEQNGYLVGSSEVGSKQVVRQRHDHKGRDKLPQIEGCGEQGHDGGGRVLASLDTGDSVQVRYAHAVGYTDKHRAKQYHRDAGNEIGSIAQKKE